MRRTPCPAPVATGGDRDLDEKEGAPAARLQDRMQPASGRCPSAAAVMEQWMADGVPGDTGARIPRRTRGASGGAVASTAARACRSTRPDNSAAFAQKRVWRREPRRASTAISAAPAAAAISTDFTGSSRT